MTEKQIHKDLAIPFHKKYRKVSSWWKFIRQEFRLEISHSEFVGIFDREYEDHFVKLSKNGVLTLKVDFIFGASGPTIDTKSSRRASCVHDGLYWLSQEDVFRGCCSDTIKDIADKLLYRMCREDGMWKWRSRAWLAGVKVGGRFSWEV